MGGKDTIIHSIQHSNLNRGVLGSVCWCGVRQRTMQSEMLCVQIHGRVLPETS